MSQGPTSPFDSTFAPFVPKPPADGGWSAPPEANLRYMRSIEYVFENPQWLMNVIWILLCSIVAAIVPVLPQMVLMGYQFEVVEALLSSRGSFYPNFETNRISDYLTRGVWVFLAAFLAGIAVAIAMATIIGLWFLATFGLISALGEGAATFIVPVMIVTGAIIFLSAGIVANLVLVPIVLRAGLSQDFGQAFDFAWIKDFIAKTWTSMIARGLFAMVASMALLFVGFTGMWNWLFGRGWRSPVDAMLLVVSTVCRVSFQRRNTGSTEAPHGPANGPCPRAISSAVIFLPFPYFPSNAATILSTS